MDKKLNIDEKTNAEDLGAIIKEQTEEEFAVTHNGYRTWIDYFNNNIDKQIILISRFDKRTTEKKSLRTIVKHLRKLLKRR